MRRLALLAVLLLVAAGCGSGGASSGGGAVDLVPPEALAFVAVDSDFGSGQITSAQAILDKFPIKTRLLAELGKAAAQQGIDLNALKGSIGPELDLAVLDVDGQTCVVGLTQPSDEKAFLAQLEKSSKSSDTPMRHATISGWTAFSDKQAALDALKARKGKLSDQAAYTDAMASLPDPALVRAYVAPAALAKGASMLGSAAGVGDAGSALDVKGAKWLAAAATAADGALKVEAHAKGVGGSVREASASLAGQIPSGSIVALSFDGSGAGSAALGRATKQLGIDLQGVLGAIDGPVIGYVKPGLPIPEVTIASKPASLQRSLAAIGALVRQLAGSSAKPQPAQVEGATMQKIDLGPVAIYYGSFGDELVVTDSPNAVVELKGGNKLTGDAAFKDAADGAGLPDTNQGWVFINVKDALPAVEGFAQIADMKLPAEVTANLRPLRALLVHGSRDGDVESIVAYLSTS